MTYVQSLINAELTRRQAVFGTDFVSSNAKTNH
jgi:hypothetical protein